MSEEFKKKKISEFLKRCDDGGDTLLHYVVTTDDVVFAEKLIEAGCNINAINRLGYSPLLSAIRENKLEMVKILINAGADYHCDRSLQIASKYGSPEIVKLFLEMGADVNSSDNFQKTSLHFTNWCRDSNKSDDYCKVINILINAGAKNVNVLDEFGSTPLLYSIEQGFYAGFELMLSLGADICIDGKMNFCFLENAVWGGDVRILMRLVELGYDINMKDDDNVSCLHIAASSSSKMTEFLLSRGAVMNIDNRGMDPLCYMLDNWSDCYMCNVNDEGLDRDKGIEDEENYFDLMECVELLIKHGANVNHVTNDGMTPLYIVVERYRYVHSNVVRVLLKNGAKFDFNHPLVHNVMNSDRFEYSHLLLRHVAVYEAQNRNDGPANFNRNTLNEECQRDYTSCQDELELMKATKVDSDTNVTFFDVLVNRDIGPYTRNECIRNVFEEQTFSNKFPVYSDLMTERFSKELEYQSLVQEATDGLSHVLNWDKTSLHVPLSNILLYLDEKDLTNLALI